MKTYQELILLPTFEERFNYLKYENSYKAIKKSASYELGKKLYGRQQQEYRNV